MNSIPMERRKGNKRLLGWATSGGLNGEQASHGQTTEWAGKSLEGAGWRRFLVLLVLARGVVLWIQLYEHLAQGGQALAVGMGEEAEVTYLDEAPGEDMLQEAVDELFGGEGAELGLSGIGSAITKSDLIARSVQFDQTVVADGDAEDVGCQVLQCGAAIANRFAVGDPLLFPDV